MKPEKETTLKVTLRDKYNESKQLLNNDDTNILIIKDNNGLEIKDLNPEDFVLKDDKGNIIESTFVYSEFYGGYILINSSK